MYHFLHKIRKTIILSLACLIVIISLLATLWEGTSIILRATVPPTAVSPTTAPVPDDVMLFGSSGHEVFAYKIKGGRSSITPEKKARLQSFII
jgi:hypothetical protein